MSSDQKNNILVIKTCGENKKIISEISFFEKE